MKSSRGCWLWILLNFILVDKSNNIQDHNTWRNGMGLHAVCPVMFWYDVEEHAVRIPAEQRYPVSHKDCALQPCPAFAPPLQLAPIAHSQLWSKYAPSKSLVHSIVWHLIESSRYRSEYEEEEEEKNKKKKNTIKSRVDRFTAYLLSRILESGWVTESLDPCDTLWSRLTWRLPSASIYSYVIMHANQMNRSNPNYDESSCSFRSWHKITKKRKELIHFMWYIEP